MRYLRNQDFTRRRTRVTLFFWLKTIRGVVDVVQESHGLVLSFRSRRLTQTALQDLIGLYARYGLPMEGLAQFATPKNSSWFRAPEMYWHERVFVKAKDPSSRFVRSPFMRWLTDGGVRGDYGQLGARYHL